MRLYKILSGAFIFVGCCLLASTSFKVPPSFGKTHFIVGYSDDNATQVAQDQAVPTGETTSGGVQRVLFAPDDDVQQVLVELIDNETDIIQAAIFMLTAKEVAHALIEAHKRGVKVEVITDNLCARERWSKVHKLTKAGIPVYEYKPAQTEGRMNDLMHNKFVVFGNCCNKALVWTGSCNFTRSAKLRNQENAVILNDADAVAKYTQQFAILKTRSKRL